MADTLPELADVPTPPPIHRQVGRSDAWGVAFNRLSLAMAVLRTEAPTAPESPRVAWAARVLASEGVLAS